MQGFPGIFCYILGVKVTDLVSLSIEGIAIKLRTLVDNIVEKSTCLTTLKFFFAELFRSLMAMIVKDTRSVTFTPNI